MFVSILLYLLEKTWSSVGKLCNVWISVLILHLIGTDRQLLNLGKSNHRRVVMIDNNKRSSQHQLTHQELDKSSHQRKIESVNKEGEASYPIVRSVLSKRENKSPLSSSSLPLPSTLVKEISCTNVMTDIKEQNIKPHNDNEILVTHNENGKAIQKKEKETQVVAEVHTKAGHRIIIYESPCASSEKVGVERCGGSDIKANLIEIGLNSEFNISLY